MELEELGKVGKTIAVRYGLLRANAFGLVKSFLVFLAYSNLLLAIGAALASYSGCIIVGLPVTDFVPFIIVFLITFSIYNLNRRTDLAEDEINHPERVKFIRTCGTGLLFLSVLSYIIALSLALLRNLQTFLVSLLPIIIVGFYSLRWAPRSIREKFKFSRFKEIFAVKNSVVALTFASMMFLLLNYFSASVTLALIIAFLFLFLRFFINTVMFDVRDIEGDRKCGIRTLPVTFDTRTTKNILYMLNSCLGFFLLACAILRLASPIPLFLINLSTLYGFWYISLVGKTDTKFLADVVVDGEYFVIALLAFSAHLAVLYI